MVVGCPAPMTPAELRREAKRRGILDEDDVAWFVENGAEVMLFEEALRAEYPREAAARDLAAEHRARTQRMAR